MGLRKNEDLIGKQLLATYQAAHHLVEQKAGKANLEAELSHYRSNKPNSLEAVYKRLLESLKNMQGYVNYIAPIDEVMHILGGSNPQHVNHEYGGNIELLYRRFEAAFGHKYRFNFDDKRNSWLKYTKGTLSAAKFLANFKNYSEFDEFVESFSLNEFTIAALPMLLSKEIFLLGFPLACDFLKEIGYMNYGKPDVHLKDIFIGLGLIPEGGDTDYETFKAIVRTALLADTEPVIVDKVYWIIGSGKLENSSGAKIGRLKKQFIAQMQNSHLFR